MGEGGKHSEPTNRTGAFYFSCSAHGGFVIDARALTDEELVSISPYVSFEDATLYTWARRRVLMHPYRGKSAKVSAMARITNFKFLMLEEDCDWCLAYLFTAIRHKNKPALIDHSQSTFDRWIKPRKIA